MRADVAESVRDRLAAVDALVTREFNAQPLAGLAVGIVRNGALVYPCSLAQRGRCSPASPKHLG